MYTYTWDNKELHNLYSSPYILRVTKSRKMGWAGHAARMVDVRNAYKTLVRKREEAAWKT
jgi:hypothetical protein